MAGKGLVANLKPFPKGYQPENRASKAKAKALYAGKLAAPEAVQFNLDVMRDLEMPIQARLKASENILRLAFPTQRQAQELDPHAGTRFLEVVFIRPGEQLEGKRTEDARTFTVNFDTETLGNAD